MGRDGGRDDGRDEGRDDKGSFGSCDRTTSGSIWLPSSIPDFFQALCIVSGVMAFFLAACQTSKKSTLSITIEVVKEYRSEIQFLNAQKEERKHQATKTLSSIGDNLCISAE